MDPQQKSIADEFDQYKDTYENAVDKAVGIPYVKVDFFSRVKAEYLLDSLKKIFAAPVAKSTPLKVLDVGCGIGLSHKILDQPQISLSGVDISSECVDQAKARNPSVDYKCYDGVRLPYDDDTFDAAQAVCVVHHVPPDNWPQFFRELHRVVRPGGMVTIFEHNPLNPVTMRIVDRCPFDKDAVLLKSGTTEKLLADAGLVDVRSRFIFSIPAANRFLRWIDRLFSRIPFGAQYQAISLKPGQVK